VTMPETLDTDCAASGETKFAPLICEMEIAETAVAKVVRATRRDMVSGLNE
jgi:hypothetical protein